MSVTSRWLELADIKDELAARDWFPGTSGNVAIRVSDDPLTFLVSASGRDKRKRTPDDFVLVDGAGKLLGDQTGKPSAETQLHVEIFNRTSAACSLHVHTVDNNVMSELYAARGEVTFAGQELLKALGHWEEDAVVHVPIIDNHAHIPTLAAAFKTHVTHDAGAVLIRNHGITVWGETPEATKRYLEAYEFLFSYTLKLRALGVHS